VEKAEDAKKVNRALNSHMEMGEELLLQRLMLSTFCAVSPENQRANKTVQWD
jgi:hypothetical protein